MTNWNPQDKLEPVLVSCRLQASNLDDAGNLQEGLALFIMELNMHLARVEAGGQIWWGLEMSSCCPMPTRWARRSRTTCVTCTDSLSIKIIWLLLVSISQIKCKTSLVIHTSLELCHERNSGKHNLDTLTQEKAKCNTQAELFPTVLFKWVIAISSSQSLAHLAKLRCHFQSNGQIIIKKMGSQSWGRTAWTLCFT